MKFFRFNQICRDPTALISCDQLCLMLLINFYKPNDINGWARSYCTFVKWFSAAVCDYPQPMFLFSLCFSSLFYRLYPALWACPTYATFSAIAGTRHRSLQDV